MQGAFDMVVFVVHGKALDDVFTQPMGCPDAKLCATVGLHSVADGDDDIEVVVLRVIGFTIIGSYPEIPDN